MRRRETREVMQRVQVEIGATCDGCGVAEGPGAMGALISVVIAVGEGEDGGAVDALDYCNDCIVERAPALAKAGCRAALVTGDWATRS